MTPEQITQLFDYLKTISNCLSALWAVVLIGLIVWGLNWLFKWIKKTIAAKKYAKALKAKENEQQK